jgi:hypothetical protein
MKPPFDLSAFRAKVAALRNPRGPVPQRLPHVVTLKAPRNDQELHERWKEPQDWCWDNVQHGRGDLWSRRRDIRTGAIEFSFSCPSTGVAFALEFRRG